MLGTSILLGLSGPFETFEALPLLPRVAYWAVIVFVTYCTAITVINLVQTLLPETWPNLLRDGIAGSCAGPILAVIVTVINAMTFTANTADLPSFQTLLLYTTIIAATVSILIGMAFGNTEPHSANESSDQTPPLFKRLPFDKRGPIVSLQAQDHYVLVTTTAGSHPHCRRNGRSRINRRVPDAQITLGRPRSNRVVQTVGGTRNTLSEIRGRSPRQPQFHARVKGSRLFSLTDCCI